MQADPTLNIKNALDTYHLLEQACEMMVEGLISPVSNQTLRVSDIDISVISVSFIVEQSWMGDSTRYGFSLPRTLVQKTVDTLSEET